MNSVDLQPLVTIVVPSFNHAPYVRTCIEGIIRQTYRNIELIVIDDGSTDDSVDRIAEIADVCRVRFRRFEFRARANRGLSATLDEALEWARGRYFAAIASDDVLLPEKTSVLVSKIEGRDDLAGVFGGGDVVDASGKILYRYPARPAIFSFSDILARRHCILAPSQLLRADMVRAVGGYAEGTYIEDWYMWLKLTESGARLITIDDVLVLYRLHGGNMSGNALRMYESRKQIIGMFSRYPEARIAMSDICVLAAIDFSRASKIASIHHVAEALGNHGSVVFRSLFWSAIARIATPVAALDALKETRKALRRSFGAAIE